MVSTIHSIVSSIHFPPLPIRLSGSWSILDRTSEIFKKITAFVKDHFCLLFGYKTSLTMTLSTPLFVEAKSPNRGWRITSDWTDELAEKVVAFLTNNPFEFYGSGKAPSTQVAKTLVQGARERAKAGIPFTRFPILDVQGTVIGEFAIGFSDDPRKLELAGRGLKTEQHKGIGTEILDWCLTQYLPELHRKGFRLPVFESRQDSVPWGQKKIKEWVDLTDTSVVATVHPDHIHCNNLLKKKGFSLAKVINNEHFQGVHDGRRHVYEMALAPYIQKK